MPAKEARAEAGRVGAEREGEERAEEEGQQRKDADDTSGCDSDCSYASQVLCFGFRVSALGLGFGPW